MGAVEILLLVLLGVFLVAVGSAFLLFRPPGVRAMKSWTAAPVGLLSGVLTGLFGKGLFLAVALVTSPVAFVGVVIAVALVDSAFIPFRNAIFHANYERHVRGRLFGGVVSLMNLVLVGTSLIAAAWLDRWEPAYRELLDSLGQAALIVMVETVPIVVGEVAGGAQGRRDRHV